MVEVAIAGFAVALVAILSVGGGALYRLGKMAQEIVYTRDSVHQEVSHSRELQQRDTAALDQRINDTKENLNQKIDDTKESLREIMLQEFQHSRELERAQHEVTRAEIRRLAEAFLSHYHDEDGNIRFRIPPSLGTEA